MPDSYPAFGINSATGKGILYFSFCCFACEIKQSQTVLMMNLLMVTLAPDCLPVVCFFNLSVYCNIPLSLGHFVWNGHHVYSQSSLSCTANTFWYRCSRHTLSYTRAQNLRHMPSCSIAHSRSSTQTYMHIQSHTHVVSYWVNVRVTDWVCACVFGWLSLRGCVREIVYITVCGCNCVCVTVSWCYCLFV